MSDSQPVPNTHSFRSRWRSASSHPAFLVAALAVGIALLFGGRLLASQHHETETPAESHGTAHTESEEHHDEGVEHPPNLVGIVAGLFEGRAVHYPDDVDGKGTEAKNPVARYLLIFQPAIFSAIVLVILLAGALAATRNMQMVPRGIQNFVEYVVESLDGFVKGVIGPQGSRFVPFIGTLFLYIYGMNVIGLFPLGFGSTSTLETTVALALWVFVYVQWTAIRMNGVLGYAKHIAGDPKSPLEWGMSVLIFPLHLVGEIAKPISLSLRLFGNILGGETLLAVFIGLGVAILASTGLPIGVPLQVIFIPLEILVTFIQALVFTLLTTIYFSLVIPHEEHHA